MTIHVFAGPTIAAVDVLAHLPAVVSGPAAFGDVYRAARQRPTAIAIIDGYFERVPATWHKEILWAMAEGVHVFGASSMGALRAAELCDFGMVGVGRIFEAFRSGDLEDDDEVAIAHGDADSGFRPGSDAMVNIRATLHRAEREQVLDERVANDLMRLAKSMFYAQRSYPALLEAASSAGVEQRLLARFRAWLPAGRVDQKRADAEQLLEHLKTWQATAPQPLRVAYSFEATDAWHEAERVAAASLSEAQTASVDDGALDELKLENGYAPAHAAAAARGWSLDAARRAGIRPDPLAIRTAVETFRRDAGLTERQAFERWRTEQHLDDASLSRFFDDRARGAWAEPLNESLGRAQVISQLQASAEYGRLRQRAEQKAQRLHELGLESPSLSDARVTEQELWQWYFVQRLEREQPSDLDVFARSAGFANTEELRRTVLRERCFEAWNDSAATKTAVLDAKPASAS